MPEVEPDEVEIQPKSSVKVSERFRIGDYYGAFINGKYGPIPGGTYHMSFRYDLRLMGSKSTYAPPDPKGEWKDELARIGWKAGDDLFVPWSKEVIELRVKDD
jgi:hypothetical protein